MLLKKLPFLQTLCQDLYDVDLKDEANLVYNRIRGQVVSWQLIGPKQSQTSEESRGLKLGFLESFFFFFKTRTASAQVACELYCFHFYPLKLY